MSQSPLCLLAAEVAAQEMHKLMLTVLTALDGGLIAFATLGAIRWRAKTPSSPAAVRRSGKELGRSH